MILYNEYFEELTPQKLSATLNKFFVHIEKEYGEKNPHVYFIDREVKVGEKVGAFAFYNRT